MNTLDRCFRVCEVLDTPLFNNVEALMLAMGVKECLMVDPVAHSDGERLQAALERCDIIVTSVKKQAFKADDLEQDLGRLLKHTTTPLLSRRAFPVFHLQHSVNLNGS